MRKGEGEGPPLKEEISADFRSHFPLVSSKLDSPEKVKAFFDFVKFCVDSPDNVARIAEEVIRKHETEGLDVVSIDWSRDEQGHKKMAADTREMLVYFTQGPPTELRKILFPGLRSSGSSTKRGLHFDWREDGMKIDNPDIYKSSQEK